MLHLLSYRYPKYVKSFTDKNALFSAKDKLPQDAYENLEWLINDIPYDEVLELCQSQLKETEDNSVESNPLKSPVAMKYFVVVEGEDELKKIGEFSFIHHNENL